MAKRGESRTNGRSGVSGRRDGPNNGRRPGRSADRSGRSRSAGGPRRASGGRPGSERTRGKERGFSREDREDSRNRRSEKRFAEAEDITRSPLESEPQPVFQGGDSGDIPAFLRRYIHKSSEVTTNDDREEAVVEKTTEERSEKRYRNPRESMENRRTVDRRTVDRRSGDRREKTRSGGERGTDRGIERETERRGSQKPMAKKPVAKKTVAKKPVTKKPVESRETTGRADSVSQPGRLQKVLAAAGLGARRQCEELITTGRVEIDRKVVTELGTRVDPTTQEIRVDGVILPKLKPEYYALHKPKGFVTTSSDPAGRSRVIDLIPSEGKHLFAVGRLDMSSEGLILITSDGDWAERITHPRYGVEKTYRVIVDGVPERSTLAQLERGVYLAEGLARVKRVTFKRRMKNQSILELVLDEGRNREIRRVLAKVGHKVHRLVRIAVGPIRLGELPVGAYRPLTKEEIRGVIDEVARRRRESHTTVNPNERTRPPRAVQFSELREVQENTAREEEREREKTRRNDSKKSESKNSERNTGTRGSPRQRIGRGSTAKAGAARKTSRGKTIGRGRPASGGRKPVRGRGTTRGGGKRK